MATTMQLSDLQAAIFQRADMVGSQFVSTPELTSYINQSYFELYDLLVSAYGEDYFVASPAYTVTTDGVSELFALPSDFYKLLGVDLQVTPQQWMTLKPFAFSERNKHSYPNYQSPYGITNLRYRPQGNFLWLRPLPMGAQTLRLWYVPKLAPLVNGTDTVDGVSGWTEYIIVDGAIKCLQKQESDVSVLMAQKQALAIRILEMAENRDVGTAMRVADVRGDGGDWNGYGFGESY